MKDETKFVLLITVGFTALLFFYFKPHRMRRSQPGAQSDPAAGNYGLPQESFVVLDDHTRDTLKCRYLPNAQLRQKGVYVADIIAGRMQVLQRNRHDRNAIMAQAHNNRWTYYEAIYQEALQQVLREDLIDYAPEDTCYAPGLGVTATSTPVSQAQA